MRDIVKIASDNNNSNSVDCVLNVIQHVIAFDNETIFT
jgi:hypothetical protein